MGRAAASDSESDDARTKRQSTSKSTKKNKKEFHETDSYQEETNVEEDGDEDEEEEEYEIEEIIEARHGTFEDGNIGYRVKWKGYDSSHNSWVNERDAGNASALIEEYWRKHRKEKKGRKSIDARSKSAKLRKSAVPEDISDNEREKSVTKKRGRPSKAKPDSDVEMSDVEAAPAKKKPRKSNGAPKTKDSNADEEEEIGVGNMKKHMSKISWDDLVEKIDTVERMADGSLMVYFTIAGSGEQVKENSALCAERFPQKMIAFYESNLKWRFNE